MNQNSNYDPWLSSEELELLNPSKNRRRMNHRKIDKNKKTKRNIFTRIIPFFGCILVALGTIGIVGALSSPFSLIGGMLYLTTGIFISLTYSSFLRHSFLKLLSPATKALLFERSLLDVVTETSPLAKGYALISMASMLDRKDIQILSEKLPEECDFLRRRGLVHLLPSSLKEIFIGNNGNINFMENCNPSVISYDDSHGISAPHFVIPKSLLHSNFENENHALPISQLEPRNNTAITTISAINPTVHHNMSISHETINNESNQNTIRNHFNITYSAPESPNTPVNYPSNLTPVNTPTIPSSTNNPQSHCNFDQTLQNIINRRAKITSDWLIDEFKSILSSNAYYFASGGEISDTLMVRMFTVSAVGLTTAISVSNRFPLTNKNTYSNNRFGSLMKFISNYFVPYVSTITAVSGGMLAVRHFKETKEKKLSILYKILDRIKCTYTSISINENPTIMCVMFAWSLVALLAYRLKMNIKNLRWVFQRVLSKLLQNVNTDNV